MIRATSAVLAGITMLAGLMLHRPAACGTALEAFFTTSDFYDQTIASAETLDPGAGAVGMVVNHHLVGGTLAAHMFSTLTSVQPRRIILISPDHFAAGPTPVTVSTASWHTPYGTVFADCGSIDRTGLRQDISSFGNEHGISALVPYIRHYDPHAEIIAVMVKKSATKENVADAVRRLSRVTDADTFIIGSFDFSHYQPKALADVHDAASLQSLQSMDADAAYDVEVDSPPGLALTIALARMRSARSFELVSHENSASLTGETDPDETTSYVDGIFKRRTAALSEPAVTVFIEPGAFAHPALTQGRTQEDVMTAERQMLAEKGTDAVISPASSETRIERQRIAFDYIRGSAPDTADLIAQLHAEGHYVAVFCGNAADMHAADLVFDCALNPAALDGTPLHIQNVATAIVLREKSVSLSFLPVTEKPSGFSLASADARAATARLLSAQLPHATISHITVTLPR